MGRPRWPIRTRVSGWRTWKELLAAHRLQMAEQLASLGVALDEEAFSFSGAPDCSTPLQPRSVSQRYRRMAQRLRLRSTRLHSLRRAGWRMGPHSAIAIAVTAISMLTSQMRERRTPRMSSHCRRGIRQWGLPTVH